MPKKVDTKEVQELLDKGLKHKPIDTYTGLGIRLEKLGVTPGEAFRIINEKKHNEREGSIRFNWKMIRFTMFIWARIEEERNGYMKPKIDTVRGVVRSRNFEYFFYGYYPDLKLKFEDEERKLNKLIAEKPQQKFFKEGYYYFHKTKKLVPQPLLDKILSAKK
jgi:hypothetical protein